MHQHRNFYRKNGKGKQTLKQTKKPEKIINEMTEKVAEQQAIALETIISLAINPKPRWLPRFLYQRMVRLCLKVETFQGNIKNLVTKNESNI